MRVAFRFLHSIATRVTLAVTLFSGACAVSSHPTEPARFGVSRPTDALLAVIDQPGPWSLDTVSSADWSVDRSGLINLKASAARVAKLKDGLEPIQIFFHALRHPQHGLYIIDTGVERALRDDRERAALRGFVADAFGAERIRVLQPLGDYLASAETPLRGVFLTHMHADHILGLPDVPATTPIYAAEGEAHARALMNVVVQHVSDRLLEHKQPLRELHFAPDSAGRFNGVLDLFGDGSLWALWVPGHTVGSVAYLARTTSGPVLITGDTCHTAWGWQHEVEPGTFTADHERNQDNLLRLRRLVREHPQIAVRLGHQALPQQQAAKQ